MPHDAPLPRWVMALILIGVVLFIVCVFYFFAVDASKGLVASLCAQRYS
jgi:hypothetical protein